MAAIRFRQQNPWGLHMGIVRGITVQGAVAADINHDDKLDIAVIAGRSNKLVWYESR